MNNSQFDSVLAEVKANNTLLNACKLHAFVPILQSGSLVRKYMCTECKGVVDHHAFHWYERGFAHGEQLK